MNTPIITSKGSCIIQYPDGAFGFDVNNYADRSELMYMLDVSDIDPNNKHDETLIVKHIPFGNWRISHHFNKDGHNFVELHQCCEK